MTEGKDAATIAAFIKGVETNLPNARITFDKFHVVTHAANRAANRSGLKGLRWSLLKDRARLTAAQRADLDVLIVNVTTKRTARAWLDRKQINVVSDMLEQ